MVELSSGLPGPARRETQNAAQKGRKDTIVSSANDRLQSVLSSRNHSSVELAQVSVHWFTTLLPEARSVIMLLAENTDRVSVLAADVALKSARDAIFSLHAEAAPRAALGKTEVVQAPFAGELRRRLPWSAEIGERRSLVSCRALPQIANGAVVCVFHAPGATQLVEGTLESLAELLREPKRASSPDPAIYSVISRAKREWERTVDALDQLVLLLDRKGAVVRANRTVERWGLGSVCDVRGSSVHDVLHPKCLELSCRLARLLSCRWKQVRAEGATSFELYDPQLEKALQLTLQPISETEGRRDTSDTSFGVVVVKDVTELHQTQRKLQQLNDELEVRVRERTKQLQTINRDLREQIAWREVAERELQESRDELARLSQQLIDTQEGERRRIALELHDSLGQSLGALKYSLERYIAVNANPALGDADRVLDAAIKQLQRAIHDARSISMSLRPSLLDDMGAVSAVRWLCRWFGETYVDIHVINDCRLTDSEIPERLAAPIFRIIQEALNNVAKHASARNVLVMLRRTGTGLSLEVRDDGVGFDPEARGPAEQRLGLIGMRERATMTGGKFMLLSGPDVSTQVRVDWELGEADGGPGSR